ncbi:hypothetical protein D3C81_1426260 [compost metagenome]|uniref:Uncharacterized protein n=1 Tax=Cupriavidus campinensis TaxID=151783 RepID=A0AAE9L573_9BURK|nr:MULTISPECIES: hypothetical protein [Cupriavidus]TSP13302.1 hypothetical protein FGG12_06530 [Cupriavidus campinensis]URF07663.1 hypothetical protein M5D45_20995 [Cupriavidus campinensis]CAG2143791.1 hypothetical protein LMG19282_02450 [Cupriavidus campinensis]
MSSIVAGRFASIPEAEEIAQKLYARGFSVWDVSIMSVNPGGARPPGVLLAARAKGDRREEVADVLREGGACDIERASGTWEGGQWADFDPKRQPKLVDTPEGECWPAPAASRHSSQSNGDARPAHAGPVAEEAVAVDSTGNEDPGSELEHYVDRQVSSHS